MYYLNSKGKEFTNNVSYIIEKKPLPIVDFLNALSYKHGVWVATGSKEDSHNNKKYYGHWPL